MLNSGVYIISNNANGKVYVGSSKNVKSRWTWHKGALRGGYHHSRKLQSAFNKYGEDSFSYSLIVSCHPSNLDMYEQLALDSYQAVNSGYNICPHPNSVRGVKYDIESIAKSAKNRTGAKRTLEMRERMAASQRGKKRSPESVAKTAAANTGRKMSAEVMAKVIATRKANGRTPAQLAHMKKMQEQLKGKKLTPEHRAKMSQSRKGRKLSPETIAKIVESNRLTREKKKGVV